MFYWSEVSHRSHFNVRGLHKDMNTRKWDHGGLATFTVCPLCLASYCRVQAKEGSLQEGLKTLLINPPLNTTEPCCLHC